MNKAKTRIRKWMRHLGLQEIGTEASKLFIIQMITMAISFFPSILISRTIGPEMKGKYDLFNLLSSYIVEFGLLGFGSGLLYYQLSRKYALSKVHGTGIAFSLGMGGVLIMAGLFSLHVWEQMLQGLPTKYMILAFALCPFSFYKLIFGNILIGMNKAILNYSISLALGVFDFLFVSILFFSDNLNYSKLIILTTIETVIITIIGVVYLYNKSHGLSVDFKLLINALRYGIVLYIGVMANSILFKIDTLFINYYKGNEAVGIYSVAVRWAEMLFLFDSAISTSSIYRISTVERKEARVVTAKTVRLQFAVSASMGVVMLLVAYPLIYLLYGKAYITATLPLIVLLPGIVSWSTGKIVSQFIVYKMGKALYCAVASIIGCVVNMILNAVLIPQFNIVGAAIASTISYWLVVGVIFLIFYYREYGD